MHQYHHHHEFHQHPSEGAHDEHTAGPCGCHDEPHHERREECCCQSEPHQEFRPEFRPLGVPGSGPHGDCGCRQEPPREGPCAPRPHGGPTAFRRRFFTREEKIARLLNYLDALYAEAEAVEERLAGLGVDLDDLAAEASEAIEDETSVEHTPTEDL
jgi:hypothetical protein